MQPKGGSDVFARLQVTQNEARVLEASSGNLVGTWQAGTALAKVVSTGANLVLACTGKGHTYVLQTSLSGVECVAEADLAVEVACLDMATWALDGALTTVHVRSRVFCCARSARTAGEAVLQPSLV